MTGLFALLILTSLILLVIGVFKPQTSLFWNKTNPTRKKSLLVYSGLTFLLFILFVTTIDKKPISNNGSTNINSEKTENRTQEDKPNIEPKKVIIQKIKNKRERRDDGEFNEMTLFVVDSSITSEELSNYCSDHKSEYKDGYFQILVFFKNANAVRFPDNPITATYMEEKDLKNIKAIYEINNFNGYSKLDYYDKNGYESKPNLIEIK
jgi:hypothetical protein